MTFPAVSAPTVAEAEWVQFVLRASGQARAASAQTLRDGPFPGAERTLALALDEWLVVRARFPRSAHVRAGLHLPRGARAGGRLVQARGRQVVLVEGPAGDARPALRLLQAAWGALPHPTQIDATVVVLPTERGVEQFVATTSWSAEARLRQQLDGLSRGLRALIDAREPLLRVVERTSDAVRVRRDRSACEVWRDAGHAGAVWVLERNLDVARRLASTLVETRCVRRSA